MEPLPHDISEKIVQCFGRCFHYKDGVTAFLVSAGLNRQLASKHNHLAKFVWGRQLLLELAESEDGRVLQRKILAAFCKLKSITDTEVDKKAAMEALHDLQKTALDQHLVKEQDREDLKQKREAGDARTQLVKDRANKLQSLRNSFVAGFSLKDRQKAGYELERVIKELFLLSEIEFTPSFRTETSQVDGHFRFEGFDYLVEAKWRAEQPNQKEIAGFKDVVDGKLASTRGVFFSIAGYREEVIRVFNQPGARVILMDGEHLMHLLEGRIELKEALRHLITHASMRGEVYTKFPL